MGDVIESLKLGIKGIAVSSGIVKDKDPKQKLLDFASAFNDIIVDKLQSAIETRKEQIAQTMFNYQEKETPEE